MLIDEAGVWTERTKDGALNLVVKAPTHALRAVHRLEAPVSLRIAVVELDGVQLLIFGLRIEDEPGCPSTSFGPLRDERDLEELLGVLEREAVPVHLFNELVLNLLRLDCTLPPETQDIRSRLVDCVPHLTDLRKAPRATIDAIMDHFHTLEGSGQGDVRAVVHVTETLPLARVQTTELEVVHLGAGAFRLSDLDEGGELERLVYPLFEWLCPTRAYLSPHVGEGPKRRELTDLLAFTPTPELTQEGFFLVESKALSVAAAQVDKSSTKRAKSVLKDIRKGIRQVLGAAKRVYSGAPITTREGQPIDIQERAKQAGHGIVLLSELHSGVDWGEVAGLVEKARPKLLVHVLDLTELQKLVSQSEGRPAVFEHFLIERWKAVLKQRSLVRLRVLRPGVDPDYSD
jgi:hypothetical protein